VDDTKEYQHGSLLIKSLLKEAEIARQKGQWKRSQDLLFEVRKISKDFQIDENWESAIR
jgi:hypothetical protein